MTPYPQYNFQVLGVLMATSMGTKTQEEELMAILMEIATLAMESTETEMVMETTTSLKPRVR